MNIWKSQDKYTPQDQEFLKKLEELVAFAESNSIEFIGLYSLSPEVDPIHGELIEGDRAIKTNNISYSGLKCKASMLNYFIASPEIWRKGIQVV